jgi:hypothetical protein
VKVAKIVLGIFLALGAIIIGFIDVAGMFLYLFCLGYIGAVFYLIDHNKYFSEFYRQLSRPYGENGALSHMFSPLILGAYLYGILTLPLGSSNITRLDCFLLSIAAIIIYFVIVFLPAIIRTKRKLY